MLDRQLRNEDKARIEKGISLDHKTTAPCAISQKKNNTLEITLHEGRKRQVRRMFAVFGYRVEELKRLRESSLSLGKLREGEWRYLTDQEIRDMHIQGRA